MAPIFSPSIKDSFADILIPNQDDWKIASNHFFISGCSDSYTKEQFDKLNTNWNSKKNICIFRGSATGCGITIDTNVRLKAAQLSFENPDILDAGITNWNAKMKKYKSHPIKIINTQLFPFELKNEINNIEKSNYKYILNLDGHVSAFRLSFELTMNSVILLAKSDYKMWYSDFLKEYEHYIPIKSDLSNLIEQLKWCIKNDNQCKKIAKNATLFYDKYINKNGIFNYLENQFHLIYYNKNCKNLLDIKKCKKNIALITIFRDNSNGERDRERKLFIEIMNKLLEPYSNFHIYIIEQSNDNNLFNIGKLKNIGFKIASNEYKYDNYIFSDIDTIPNYDLIKYFYIKNKNPIALGIRGTRYEQKNKKINKLFLGALISFNSKTFTKINGYPNNFWGWGGEDDALVNRLVINNKRN
jgi:hypothetical protein